ncbi:hypothetical protein KO481_21475 [Nocardia sp. NEAU-G5]|uniref:Uncharacterized protein n=1 Tax=Nocardia albiluteola TaxID=2842303 RepID=A0ABS6B424_9NOCA|nr:hypothetical protein [Nocardia albiluteola]MBU3064090.1 hypothetical protein [Nocardia albiluteola]
MTTVENRFAGHPAELQAALEALAAAERDLRATNWWAIPHLNADASGDVAPQAIADAWRDHALIIKRAARRWEKAQAAVLALLGAELPKEGGE